MDDKYIDERYTDEYIETVYFKALTDALKAKIKAKYKSIKQFSDASGIPYMTISNVLKRGIGNSSVGTVLRICNAAQIPFSELLDECKHVVPEDITDLMQHIYVKR